MLYFSCPKIKKKGKIFLARSKMKLFFVAACGAVHSNLKLFTLPICHLWNQKCYLRFLKISSEIGPFFKDNLLPVTIRARECHCQCLSIKLFHCALTLLPSAVVQVICVSSSDGVYQTSSIKVYSLWSSSR